MTHVSLFWNSNPWTVKNNQLSYISYTTPISVQRERFTVLDLECRRLARGRAEVQSWERSGRRRMRRVGRRSERPRNGCDSTDRRTCTRSGPPAVHVASGRRHLDLHVPPCWRTAARNHNKQHYKRHVQNMSIKPRIFNVAGRQRA